MSSEESRRKRRPAEPTLGRQTDEYTTASILAERTFEITAGRLSSAVVDEIWWIWLFKDSITLTIAELPLTEKYWWSTGCLVVFNQYLSVHITRALSLEIEVSL